MESHSLVKNKLGQAVTDIFLQEAFKVTSLSYPETVAILYKYYTCITSPILLSGIFFNKTYCRRFAFLTNVKLLNLFILTGFHEWLTVGCVEADVLEISSSSLLKTLISGCSSDNDFLATTSLEFFVVSYNIRMEK